LILRIVAMADLWCHNYASNSFILRNIVIEYGWCCCKCACESLFCENLWSNTVDSVTIAVECTPWYCAHLLLQTFFFFKTFDADECCLIFPWVKAEMKYYWSFIIWCINYYLSLVFQNHCYAISLSRILC